MRYRQMFLVAALIYVYFFVAFGSLCVNGRLILAFSFLSILVFLLGLVRLVATFWSRRRKPVRE